MNTGTYMIVELRLRPNGATSTLTLLEIGSDLSTLPGTPHFLLHEADGVYKDYPRLYTELYQ